MLDKNEVWNVVDKTRLEPTTIPQMKKKNKDNTIVSKIIKQGVDSDLYINVIEDYNLH